jgi:hypothetical protein
MPENSKINYLIGGVIVGGSVGTSLVGFQQPTMAITITDVTTAMTDISTNAGSVADVAFPIGAALVALGIVATVIRKFILI